ncbi:MAG: Asp-tRNA(Asn)/Glu-tRNA(Gln) amidotransferase subunit GatB [Anaerolineae bacterium]|nr:Asp-tRNA(Asn)/Glu-tRNA(Gln) amidotransferase subunit GatB [Thermoflexales bacterium]MDW8408648.1 Asp-tRNA(Asn)/Glu-tRNA(Gln) amidotransferase subunit GatB [Anaerolineae bacterium]
MEYEVVIGIEAHVEQSTRSKMFCSCSADFFGAEPNTNVCPTCLGMPGALPVINQRAVEFCIMVGLALNCKIARHTFWERKSYWYPDLPKGYQISQYQYPLCYDGYIDVDVRDLSTGNWTEECYRKRIRIRRAHLEEDTGKLTHLGSASFVDYNRSGVPLIEIVTEPDIASADEAYAYLNALRDIVRYLGVSTGDMEKGALRGEPNMSLRPKGSDTFGTKVEIKNLNSLRAVRDSIAYEIKRQTRVLDEGGQIKQVTLGWDDVRGVTVVQREKEEAHDYRYFPEPDLPPLVINDAWLESIRARMPELPLAKQDRFMRDFGLSGYDAVVLTRDRATAEYFERVVAALGPAEGERLKAVAKSAANWVTGELFRLMSAAGAEIHTLNVTPVQLADLIRLVDDKTINLNTARQVFEEMFATGQDARAIVQSKGLAQVSDEAALARVVEDVLTAHPQQVQSYLAGNEKLFQFLTGQAMKLTKGKANPQVLQALLKAALERRR